MAERKSYAEMVAELTRDGGMLLAVFAGLEDKLTVRLVFISALLILVGMFVERQRRA